MANVNFPSLDSYKKIVKTGFVGSVEYKQDFISKG